MTAKPVIVSLSVTVWGPAKVPFQAYSHCLQLYLFWRVKCPKCGTIVSERNYRLGYAEWCGRHWRQRPRGGKKGRTIDMQMKKFDFLRSVIFKLLRPIKGSSDKIAYFFYAYHVWYRKPLYDCSSPLRRSLYDCSPLLRSPLHVLSPHWGGRYMIPHPRWGESCMIALHCWRAHCMIARTHWGVRCMIARPPLRSPLCDCSLPLLQEN